MGGHRCRLIRVVDNFIDDLSGLKVQVRTRWVCCVVYVQSTTSCGTTFFADVIEWLVSVVANLQSEHDSCVAARARTVWRAITRFSLATPPPMFR